MNTPGGATEFRWPFLASARAESGESMARPSPPTIAVVVTAHDLEEFVAEAVESVLGQSDMPEEIIVIDDGSTDGTVRSVQPYLGRVHFVQQPNGGEGAAKNTGWRAATTEYVCFFDGDDVLDPDYVAAVRGLLTVRPDLDIVVTDLEEFGPFARGFFRRGATFPVDTLRRVCLTQNLLGVPVVRRSLLETVGGMSEQLGVHADWELAMRLALHEPRVGAIAAPLYRYRRWHGQATAGELALIDARLRTLDVIGRLPALTDQERSVVRAAWHEQYVASWRASRRGRGRDARSRAWTIARSSDYPFRVRSLAAVSVILPNQMQRLSDLRGRPRLRP